MGSRRVDKDGFHLRKNFYKILEKCEKVDGKYQYHTNGGFRRTSYEHLGTNKFVVHYFGDSSVSSVFHKTRYYRRSKHLHDIDGLESLGSLSKNKDTGELMKEVFDAPLHTEEEKWQNSPAGI